MGVLYLVVPYDDEIAGYLAEFDVEPPTGETSARNPTPLEIRRVCEALPDTVANFRSKPGAFWEVALEGADDPERQPCTLLHVKDYNGVDDDPHSISFEKGWPSLILQVAQGLSVTCGPLVVIPDTGDAPIVVTSDRDIETMLAPWGSDD